MSKHEHVLGLVLCACTGLATAGAALAQRPLPDRLPAPNAHRFEEPPPPPPGDPIARRLERIDPNPGRIDEFDPTGRRLDETDQVGVMARVAMEFYGASSAPDPLAIECDIRDLRGTMLRVEGGTAGNFGWILFDTARARIDVPGLGTFLVAPGRIAHAGVFGPGGVLEMPLDLAAPELIGARLCFQGWSYPAVRHSDGLELAFHPGNRQPPLTHVGPPLTPVLCRVVAPRADVKAYDLLNRVVVPTSGYTLTLDAVDRVDGVGRVFLLLQTPRPGDVIRPETMTLRVVAPLGSSPAATIEVYIELMERGGTSIQLGLAAVVERDF